MTNLLDYLWYFCVIIAFFRASRGLYRTVESLNYINYSQSSQLTLSETKDKINLNILIPVLREQNIIEETLSRFANLEGEYKLYFITTEREIDEERQNKTRLSLIILDVVEINNKIALVEKLIGIFSAFEVTKVYEFFQANRSKKIRAKFLLELFDNRISTKRLLENLIDLLPQNLKIRINIIHYPDIKGVMAHQLNYAIDTIIKSKVTNNNRDYFLIYNADSNISSDIVSKFTDYIFNNNKPHVILQSALFLANYNNWGSGLRSGFLRSIALLQSRWTLAHEIPRIRSTQTKFGNLLEGAHVVGHGLCISAEALSSVGGFPERFTNEDLPLGYLLRLKGYKILSLPLLENAESPTSIKNVFAQYTTWFYGLLSYPEYIKYTFKNQSTNKIKALFWGMRYILRGITWFLLSLVWLYILFYPLLMLKPIELAVSLLTFLVYSYLTFYIFLKFINNNSKEYFGVVQEKYRMNWCTTIMILPAYLTHSVPTYFATWKYFKAIFKNQQIYKNKTER